MGVARTFLLWCSTNRWMSETLPRRRFVQRAVRRFMPGTTPESALAAAQDLGARGIGALLTCLGENVTTAAEAEAVCRHYLEVIDEAARRGLDAQISVKLTHLGLDLDPRLAGDHLLRLARRAQERGGFVWIDIEQSRYVDATLAAFRAARGSADKVGVCVQAYLRRTPADLDALRPLAPHIRLVKGAYREPPDVAYPRKRDVDEAYARLARRLLLDCKDNGAYVAVATHDDTMVERVLGMMRELQIPRAACEFEMLYGINRAAQERLARQGHRMRVLISYGEHWYPWYVRRLAERPANVLFVLRSLVK